MANTFDIKDLIGRIPTFNGQQRDLEHFINTCEMINTNLIKDDQRNSLVYFIKMNITDIALAKMQPLSTLNSWNEIKGRLEDKFKRPITSENAQNEIARIKQQYGEPIEIYGNKFRMALRRLNTASENDSNSEEGRKALRNSNEKFAINKFEQNILNSQLKLWVQVKSCDTLDKAITAAMEKEYQFANTRKLICNYCNKEGHTAINCRRRLNEKSQNAPNRNQMRRNEQFDRNREVNRTEQMNKNKANDFARKSNYYPRNRFNNNMKRNQFTPNQNFNKYKQTPIGTERKQHTDNANVKLNQENGTKPEFTIEDLLNKETKN